MVLVQISSLRLCPLCDVLEQLDSRISKYVIDYDLYNGPMAYQLKGQLLSSILKLVGHTHTALVGRTNHSTDKASLTNKPPDLVG